MNSVRVILVLAVVMSAIAASSQTRPKAKLISEFGVMPCGHVHAWTDTFAEEIKNDSGSRAAILICLPTSRPEIAQRHRRQISSFLQNRGLNIDQFSFYKVKVSPDGEIRTQFWKLEVGAVLPFADAVLWNEEAPDTSRPFIFGYEDEINICPTFVPRGFAKLILDNPGSRGHIVIVAEKDGVIDKFWFAEQRIKELVLIQGIPRKRLRLYFEKGSDSTYAEFWFVPARKKLVLVEPLKRLK